MFDLSANNRLTIIFIVICTKRLEKDLFGRMCNAIEEFIPELKCYAHGKRIDIHIDILISADNVEWQDASAVPINQYEWKEPVYGDNSQYQPLEIFTALANRIECYEHDKYVPILYLFGRKLRIKSANENSNIATDKAWEALQNNQIWRCAVKNSVPLIEVTDFYEVFASSREHIITDLSPESLRKGIILIPRQIDLISSQYIKLFNKHQSLGIDNNKLQADNQRLQSELKTIKDNYESIEKDFQEANRQATEWQLTSSKQIDTISSKYINLFNEYQSLVNKNNKLQADNKRLQSMLQIIKDNYESIKKEFQEANKHASKWKSSYEIIDALFQSVKSDNVKLKNNLSDSKTQADAIKEELNSCKESCDKLNRKIQSLNKKLQSTLKSNKELKENLDTSNQTAFDLKEKNKALSEENERLRGLVAMKNTELAKKREYY